MHMYIDFKASSIEFGEERTFDVFYCGHTTLLNLLSTQQIKENHLLLY